jgi:GAF domain-containing protein
MATKLLLRFVKPKTPANEELRLATLHSLNLLDTLHEERFDRITKMVKDDLDVVIVLVNLVDNGRQWFKSNQWFCPAPKVDETGRDVSFCGHTIRNGAHDVVVVENTFEDDRFADNPHLFREHSRLYLMQGVT